MVDLLNMVSNLQIARLNYSGWNECIGAFLNAMGSEAFFEVLPMRVVEYDLNSLTFAQDSRSYLLPIILKY